MASSLSIQVGQRTGFFSSSMGTPLCSPPLSPSQASSPTTNSPRNVKIIAYASTTAEPLTSTTPRFTVVKNHYQILSINQNASLMEIKTAYRNMAKRFHPDAATPESNSTDFINIQRAYAILTDPTSRALYDLTIGSTQRKQFAGTGADADASRKTSVTRRWETDQCW